VKVFLAGGTGVVGRPLVSQLVAAGHQVVATTRTPVKADLLRSLGATPAVLNALDREEVRTAVQQARPDAIVHQLTALPRVYEPRKPSFYAETGRLRREATRHLVEAGGETGVRRYVYQSICFMYRLEGPPVVDESAPLADWPGVESTVAGERLILEAGGVVLRYGQLYGPGTYFAPDGDYARRARRRLLPILGDGSGVFSFLHVEDAASAAVAALTRGEGVYNIADDDPAPAREWVPVFCAAVGAPRPWRLPLWLGRLVAGSLVADSMAHLRGASNARARSELGWAPSRSWRTGFYGPASAR
jgi:nucleoside-diphosphate-sugar epimerase